MTCNHCLILCMEQQERLILQIKGKIRIHPHGMKERNIADKMTIIYNSFSNQKRLVNACLNKSGTKEAWTAWV